MPGMTAFTVGHTEAYDAALRSPDRPQKIGRTHNLRGAGEYYAGGIVFVSVTAARMWLQHHGLDRLWSIYELDADPIADTAPGDETCPRHLLRDAVILRKAIG